LARTGLASTSAWNAANAANAASASDSVLDALAEALQLDDAERTHLFDLARSASQAMIDALFETKCREPMLGTYDIDEAGGTTIMD
jgi:hypothetical protein